MAASEQEQGRVFLVTGATGYLGHHLVALLLLRGDTVRAVVRNQSSAAELQRDVAALVAQGHHYGASKRRKIASRAQQAPEDAHELRGRLEFSNANIEKEDELKKACSNVSGIFHLAGVVHHSRYGTEEMQRTNVEATKTVVRVAAQRKCKVVYASTSGTVGCSREASVSANDSSPYCVDVVANWPYYRGKIEAELAAFAIARKNKVDFVAMRPTMMLGPGDLRYRSTRTVLSFMLRKIPFAPNGGCSFVDVRDVAKAFIVAMDSKHSSGNTYLLGAMNCSLKEFFRMLESVSLVPAPRITLPSTISKFGARVLDGYNRHIKGKWEAGVDPVVAEMASHHWNIDSSAAKRELEFRPRPPIETIRDTVEWIKKQNSSFVPTKKKTQKKLHSRL